jgi:hypothetical protein
LIAAMIVLCEVSLGWIQMAASSAEVVLGVSTDDMTANAKSARCSSGSNRKRRRRGRIAP